MQDSQCILLLFPDGPRAIVKKHQLSLLLTDQCTRPAPGHSRHAASLLSAFICFPSPRSLGCQLKSNGSESQPGRRPSPAAVIDNYIDDGDDPRPAHHNHDTLDHGWPGDLRHPLWPAIDDDDSPHHHNHHTDACTPDACTRCAAVEVESPEVPQLVNPAAEALCAECDSRPVAVAVASARASSSRRQHMAGWPPQEQLRATAPFFCAVP
jgi:hypothetical protein